MFYLNLLILINQIIMFLINQNYLILMLLLNLLLFFLIIYNFQFILILIIFFLLILLLMMVHHLLLLLIYSSFLTLLYILLNVPIKLYYYIITWCFNLFTLDATYVNELNFYDSSSISLTSSYLKVYVSYKNDGSGFSNLFLFFTNTSK